MYCLEYSFTDLGGLTVFKIFQSLIARIPLKLEPSMGKLSGLWPYLVVRVISVAVQIYRLSPEILEHLGVLTEPGVEAKRSPPYQMLRTQR